MTESMAVSTERANRRDARDAWEFRGEPLRDGACRPLWSAGERPKRHELEADR